MTARISQLTLDVLDVARQSSFWAEALGLTPDFGEDGAAKLYPTDRTAPGQLMFWLQPVTEPKREKLRLHLDLRPEDGDVEGEVRRLEDLGARRIDIGQTGEEDFTVLADPEGNEFCVLHVDPR